MPWGDNDSGPGPWGKGPKPNPEQPDIDELIRKSREKFQGFFGGSNKSSFLILALVAVVLWLASGVYIVDSEEQGVVMRFGAYNRVTDPGMHMHGPWPIEKVIKVPVERNNRMEVGTKIYTGSKKRGVSSNVREDNLMLTGDKNIAEVPFEVQWKISSASDFLFNVRNPAGTVRSVADSAMREVVGQTPIAQALAEGKQVIEDRALKITQNILDSYEAGIEILRIQLTDVQPPTQVIDSYRDVETAKQDKERAINQAISYSNDILPKAEGEARKIVLDAEAYKQQVISNAEGEAQRFMSVYDKYKVAKDVTKRRMYLETMEEILSGAEKVLLDGGAGGSGVVPYLPLPELKKR